MPASRFSFPAGQPVTRLRAGGDGGPPRIQTAQPRVCASRSGEGVTCQCSLPHRVPFGAPTGPRLGDAPSLSSQAGKPARPGPLPTELTWQQQEATQPAHHAPCPGHGPAPQPAAAGALPGTSAARPGHTPRLPPPAACRGQSSAGGLKLKALRSQSGVTGSSPHPPSSSGSLPT